MLSTDVIIYDLLVKAKKDGNKLLQHFQIGYPSKQITKDSNSIYIATVSTEPNQELFESTEYRDLVEILVVTKIKDYRRAVEVIKTIVREIIKLIKKYDGFDNKPIVRNIAPEYNPNFLLNKGHIMVEVLTEIEDEIDSKTYDKVCKILVEDIDIG